MESSRSKLQNIVLLFVNVVSVAELIEDMH